MKKYCMGVVCFLSLIGGTVFSAENCHTVSWDSCHIHFMRVASLNEWYVGALLCSAKPKICPNGHTAVSWWGGCAVWTYPLLFA